MREMFDVPEDDRFTLVTQHDADEFDYSPRYLGIARSDVLVVIQITANNTRTVEKKQALYRRIAERLVENPGLCPGDVFISLVESSAGGLVVWTRPGPVHQGHWLSIVTGRRYRVTL